MDNLVFEMYNSFKVRTDSVIRWGDLSDKQLRRAQNSDLILDRLISSRILEGRKERGIKK